MELERATASKSSEVVFKLDGVVAAKFEEVSSSCTMQKKMGEESFPSSS